MKSTLHKQASPDRSTSRFRQGDAGLLAMAALFVAFMVWQSTPVSAGGSAAKVVPAFSQAAASTTTVDSETAVFAGGCFWGVQGVFQHIKGVTAAISGYAGGEAGTADYRTVSTGHSGHAESVQVRFDPRQVSYAQLLQIYFSVAHDPTQMNRQGPDSGPQYRSALFPANEAQARIARGYIEQLNSAHVFAAPIATMVEPGRAFYPAEAYHQDFLEQNQSYPYIVINDLPKVAELKRLFPEQYRAAPVLVSKVR